MARFKEAIRLTRTVGDLVAALDGLPADTPVWLEVLGETIDIEGVSLIGDGVDTTAAHIVGAEVVS